MSVTVIQTKLNQPRRYNSRCDLAEGRRSTDVDDARETEDRMVPQVENIHAEAQLVTFLDVEILEQREVPVLLEWTTERVAWHITKTGCARRAVRNETRRPEAVRIQVMIQTIGERALRVGACDVTALAAERSSAAVGLTERATTRAVSDRERQAALISDDAADAPTLEDLVVPEIAVRNRQIVRVADHETMRPIEIAAGLVLERILLRVENVRSALAVTSDVQLVRAQRTADVVDGP